MALTDKIVKIADKTRKLTGLTTKMTLDEIASNMDLIKANPILQDKSVEITKNGTTNIVADEGYDGLNKVEVTTNIENQSGFKLNVFVQEEEPDTKEGIWIKMNDKTLKKVIISKKTEQPLIENLSYSTMPFVHNNGGSVYIDGYFYIFGGSTASYTAYKYNPKTDEYTQLKNIPAQYYASGITNIGTDIYLSAGVTGKTFYKYNTLTDTYTQLASKPTGNTGSKMIAYNNQIYSFGCDWGTSYGQQPYKYNVSTNSWSTVTACPSPLAYPSIVLKDNFVYIMGNIYSDTMQKCYKYNLDEDTYTELSDLPVALKPNTAVLVNDKYIYINFTGGEEVGVMYKYVISEDRFEEEANTSLDITNTRNFQYIDGKIYICGTTSSNNKIITLEYESFNYIDDSVIIDRNTLNKDTYFAHLLSCNLLSSNITDYYFYDVYYYTNSTGLDDSIESYYGDGTQWIEF